jgi:hypothetical protein
MEHFGWTPATVEELPPDYQDALLTIIAEKLAAQRAKR